VRLKASVSVGLMSFLLAAGAAGAQPTGELAGPSPSLPAPARRPAVDWRRQTLPLLDEILRQRAPLGLSPGQVESIEKIALDFAREVIRRHADWQAAMLDLAVILDPADPARPSDLGRAEAKIREIERVGGDVELARLRAIEAAKGQLSAEQRAKLASVLAADDPPDPPGVALVAAHSGGGGAAGHPGGGSPGHPGGGRPPGHPGHGTPGHPGGGGTPAHPPGWHWAPWGGAFVGVWPWYWWGYPAPTYIPPPAPASYWYYCPAYGAYYPDVPSCPEPWVPVPAG